MQNLPSYYVYKICRDIAVIMKTEFIHKISVYFLLILS